MIGVLKTVSSDMAFAADNIEWVVLIKRRSTFSVSACAVGQHVDAMIKSEGG